MNKPEIVFTLPSCMGGVASFNYNLINYGHLIKNFYSKVILLKAGEDSQPVFTDTFKADEVVTFHYSNRENQYYVQKRLNKLLGEKDGAIVTDNSLTVTAARVFNNPKTVFHLIHDYFYVNQAIQMGDMVDVAIAHSSFFSDAVFASSPNLFVNRIFYIPYGVQQLPGLPVKNNDRLNLVFVGRLDEAKGVMKLKEIDTGLKRDHVEVDWTIIGKGTKKQALQEQWKSNKNVVFHEPDSTKDVYNLLSAQDIFVFPTVFEGTPVSILECMANGVVTITNDLPGGIRDLVTEGTGFRCELNNINQFTERIIQLNEDRGMLQQMQKRCFEAAHNNFDITSNADNYFKKFLQYENLKRNKKSRLVKMSRLDKPYFPNALVKLIRSMK